MGGIRKPVLIDERFSIISIRAGVNAKSRIEK